MRVAHGDIKILETYRSKLRDDLPGAEGDEVVRRKVEDFANKMRPAALLVRFTSHISISRKAKIYIALHRTLSRSTRSTLAFLHRDYPMRVRSCKVQGIPIPFWCVVHVGFHYLAQ